MSLICFLNKLNSISERGCFYKRLRYESKEWFSLGILQDIQIHCKNQEIQLVLKIYKKNPTTIPLLGNLKLLTHVGKSYPFHMPLFLVKTNLEVHSSFLKMIDSKIGPELTRIVKSFLDLTITMELKKFLYRCHQYQNTQNGIQMIQNYEKTLSRNCWSPAKKLVSQWSLIESLFIPLGFQLALPIIKS